MWWLKFESLLLKVNHSLDLSGCQPFKSCSLQCMLLVESTWFVLTSFSPTLKSNKWIPTHSHNFILPQYFINHTHNAHTSLFYLSKEIHPPLAFYFPYRQILLFGLVDGRREILQVIQAYHLLTLFLLLKISNPYHMCNFCPSYIYSFTKNTNCV